MKKSIVLFLMCIAARCVYAESSSDVWTQSSGLKILSVQKLEGHPDKLAWKLDALGNDYIVTITDYFFRDGDFQEPYMADSREGKATLTIRSKEQKLFKARDEYPLRLTIKIDGKRLHKGETIYFLNGDYGEVVGHQQVK